MRPPTSLRRLAALLCAALLIGGGCSGGETSTDGAVIYANNCARCHRADGSGGVGPALGAGSPAAEAPDQDLEDVVRNGRGRMPSFRGFSDIQVRAVVDHLRSLQTP